MAFRLSLLWYTAKVYVLFKVQLALTRNRVLEGEIGRSRMATKTKLEQAVEKQAGELNPAQRELLMSQFDTYKWNKGRIKEIENSLNVAKLAGKVVDSKERKSLMNERHQLTTANVSISTKLFMLLKGTGAEPDEFESFFMGKKEES